MSNMDADRMFSRQSVLSEIFRGMGSDEGEAALLAKARSIPRELMDLSALHHGVPQAHLEIHHALTQGQPNVFMEQLSEVDGLLKTGDVVMMGGNAGLVLAQKGIYTQVRSSHVAVVHSDMMCVDAMPKIGTTHRPISSVLANSGEDWRVIRFKPLQEEERIAVGRACGFYLAQPYKIRLSRKAAQQYGYCSELARKVYLETGIKKTGIPETSIIAPAHFDRLADEGGNWDDVTDEVRPAVEFCTRYEGLIKVATALFVEGFKLNRKRFEQRGQWITQIQKAAREGRITAEQAGQQLRMIREAEAQLNHRFWDSEYPAMRRPNPAASS